MFMSNIKRKRTFIIIEILIAFSIVGIVLTGFFSYFTYLTKSQLATIHEARLDMKSEENFIDALFKLKRAHLLQPNKINPIELDKLQIQVVEKKRKTPIDGSIVIDIAFKFYTPPKFKKKKSKLIATYPLLVIQKPI